MHEHSSLVSAVGPLAPFLQADNRKGYECRMTSSLAAMEQLLLTFQLSSIRVSPTGSPDVLLWDFSFPSALHVTVEPSPLQSQTMADIVASTSAARRTPPNSFGRQLRLFRDGD
jgi:hypothetical protein